MKNTIVRFLKARKDTHQYKRYPRKLLDELLEYLRFTKVEPYVPKNSTLLDVGTGDGNFLHYLKGHIHTAVGIDPHLTHTYKFGNFHLIPGYFLYDFNENITAHVKSMCDYFCESSHHVGFKSSLAHSLYMSQHHF